MRTRKRGPRLYSRIAFRILAFNVLLAFLPVAAFLLLDTYERGLVRSLEDSLAQQARITSAWLGQGPLDAAVARRAIAAIGDRRTARFRVVDASGRLLADSSEPPPSPATRPSAGSIGGRGGSLEAGARYPGVDEVEAPAASETTLYRIFAFPARLSRRLLEPPTPSALSGDYYGSSGRLDGIEVRQALAGGYGSATRVSSGGQVSVTLYSAVPVMRKAVVTGAVLVSQSTYRILRDLYAIRLDAARIFLESLVAAAAISALLALTIVNPVARLRTAATAALGARGETASLFPDSRRGDEIGDLERALKGLFLKLDERLLQTERFAADAAHEFRNPLAAIRSAAELAETSPAAADRSRFHGAIVEDVERLRSLVEGLRRLSIAEAADGPRERIDFAAAVGAACARAAAARDGSDATQAGAAPKFSIEDRAETRGGVALFMEPSRLDAILGNLMDNACSFARTAVSVRIDCENGAAGNMVSLVVEDDGPGIPPEHLDRVFDRFFTWRPGRDRGGHTGLGLSLALALAEAEGGSIVAENGADARGARFRLKLPTDAGGARPG